MANGIPLQKIPTCEPEVCNGITRDQSVENENQEDINNKGRSRSMSSSSYYSVRSWKSVATGDADFYSVCSAESFKST